MSAFIASHSQSVLILSEVWLFWLVAAYAPLAALKPGEPRGRRSFDVIARPAMFAAAAWISAWEWAGLLIGVAGALALFFLRHRRGWATDRTRLFEWELGWNLLVPLGLFWLTVVLNVGVRFPYLHVPLPWNYIALTHFVIACFALGTAPAGYVVRGMLDKAGVDRSADVVDADEQNTLASSEEPVTSLEFRRGMLIGYLERIMAITIVAQGALGALGFLIAAKGLVRSRELEKPEFAEYFLIGTLTSMTLAFALGLFLQQLASVLLR